MEVLRWWIGGGDGDCASDLAGLRLVGLVGRMSFNNKEKKQWSKAVVQQAGHTEQQSSWDRLKRTMPPAARVLLRELELGGDRM